jgi:hypothetical protein
MLVIQSRQLILRLAKILMVQRDIALRISTKIMPVMIRKPGLISKIAYSILGKPANMQSKKTQKQLEVDRQLAYQQTSRAK